MAVWVLRFGVAHLQEVPRLEWLAREQPFGTVIHAAAYKHVPIMEREAGLATRNNVLGTENVFHATRPHARFVFISTDKAANPTSVMGHTKWLAESVVAHDARIVRFGNVLGSSGSVLEIWQRQIDAGEPITITDPDMRRYLITIEEAVELTLYAATQPVGTYTLDMGEPVSVLELAERFAPGHPVKVIGMRPGEKMVEELTNTDETIEALPGVRAQRIVRCAA